MKTSSLSLALLLASTSLLRAEQASEPSTPPAPASQSIPFDQLGTEAQKKYSGDGIRIIPSKDGAKLKAIMQDLEAEATPEGLWLTSTADEDAAKPNRFRVRAVEVGRVTPSASASSFDIRHRSFAIPPTGSVRASRDAALWLRPGLIEQYSVSTDGVRQDFIVTQRPARNGEALRVELDVSGARAEKAADGARLTIEATGRELAYSRLKVKDATGRELRAEMHVPAPDRLQVLVQDDFAVYPVCIDPTFSDADWTSMGGLPGADNTVYSMAADAGGNLYIGGTFGIAGTSAANRIVKWNGSTWSALGSGMNGLVRVLMVNGSDLYAGGDFTTAGGVSVNRIAKWNGSTWSALGVGMNSGVYALLASGSDLYAGGAFTTAGGSSASYIAKWNGSAWSALGSGMNFWVYALAMSGTDLHAGGGFTSAGGLSASHIAKWNGSAWSALGSGTSDAVNALLTNGGDIYAGGDFTTAGGISAKHIAKWNGSAWSALGSGMSNYVSALALIGGNLYAGGYFDTAGGITTSNIARWDGAGWSALGSGTGGSTPYVLALAAIGSDLYVGGGFTTAGGMNAYRIAKWNGSAWSPTGSGVDNFVYAFAILGGNLYAGGAFQMLGGVAANYIAKWDGSSWSPLGSGTNAYVSSFAISGSDLYVGGGFTTAGGVGANRIAKWDGSNWSPLGSGVGNGVSALALNGGDLYLGGDFTTAGGVSANYVAKWDGSSWSALGSGMSGGVPFTYVRALVTNGSDLYAGGAFTTAGGVSVNYIAKWNGSAWSALGSGLNGNVYALAINGSDLYAGGNFISPPVYKIGRWDGSTWSGVDAINGIAGASPFVNVLAVSGGHLYVGGKFTLPGNNIAKWNSSAWSGLGSGLGDEVRALAVSGDDLYAGGKFLTAGGKVSAYLARADLSAGATDSDGDGLLDSWERAHFAFRSAQGPLDDRDHDGYEELLELAFGLNPHAPNPGNLPPVTEEGGYLTMTITKQTGVTYEVQSAGTLLPALPDSFSASTTTVITNNATTLKVRDNFLISAAPGRFMRVKVTAAP